MDTKPKLNPCGTSSSNPHQCKMCGKYVYNCSGSGIETLVGGGAKKKASKKGSKKSMKGGKKASKKASKKGSKKANKSRKH